MPGAHTLKYAYKGDKCKDCGKDITTNSKSGRCKSCAFTGERCGKYSKKPSYDAVHQWLKMKYPKKGVCEFCKEERKTAHALIKGREYTRDRKDYMELCYSCHAKYDQKMPTAERSKLMRWKMAKARGRAIVQISLSGKVMREFPTTMDAVRELGVDRGSIHKCASHKWGYKTASGFRWEWRDQVIELIKKV